MTRNSRASCLSAALSSCELAGTLYPETDFPTGVFGGTRCVGRADIAASLSTPISTISSEWRQPRLKRLEAD